MLSLYYYFMNYKLVKCENCQLEMYFKKPIFGLVSCSNGCTFSLYNKYVKEEEKIKEDDEEEFEEIKREECEEIKGEAFET
jgi:hypothetical protein